MKIYIYTLEHPITHEIRYVGKTKNPKQRFHNHCNKSHNTKSHKRNWINSLRNQGLRPIMKTLDEVEESEWQYWERYWIHQLTVWGFRLVNHTSGGDGLTMGNETSFKKGQVAWNFTKTSIVCQQCGKEFLISPSRTEVKKFCSVKCNSLYRKGKSFINSGSFQKGRISDRCKPVLQFDLNNNFIAEFSSATEVQRKLGFLQERISAVCNNKRLTTYGYKWKFKNTM